MVGDANGSGGYAHAGRLALGTRGVLRPGRFLWLRALGWMLLLAVAVQGPALMPLLLGRILHVDVALTPALLVAILLVIYGGYVLLVRLGERRAADELALSRAPLEFGAGVLAGAGLMGLIYAALLAAGLYQVHRGGTPDWLEHVSGSCATALLEELLFRAVAFRLLARAFGPVVALALSAVLFGAAHLVVPGATLLAAIAVALEAGLLLAACLVLTGRLWLGMGLHAAWNFTQGPILGASVSGHARVDSLLSSAPADGASSFWSGGAFGPEASPLAVLVGLLAFAAIMTVAMWRIPAASQA